MTKFGDPLAEFIVDMPVVIFSPDAKQFVVITHRGNLVTDTNDYALLLYRTADLFESPHPRVLVTFASGSNSPGISDVRWAGDNETLLFIGARGEEKRQIYSINVTTARLRQLTNRETDVVSFDASDDLRTIVFEAMPPITEYFPGPLRKRGVVISDQFISDLLIGYGSDNASINQPELFVAREAHYVEQIAIPGSTGIYPSISLAPDGRHAVIASFVYKKDAPDRWNYKERFAAWAKVPTYSLLDLESGIVRPLLDAPARGGTGGIPMAWASDGRSVVVSTYLPLNVSDEVERERRRSVPFEAEIDISNGSIDKIRQGTCTLLAWDARTATALLGPQDPSLRNIAPGDNCGDQQSAYRRIDGRWQQIDRTVTLESGPPIRVMIDQGMNTPPQLSARDQKTGKLLAILDPNPEFHNLKFARVEELEFTRSDGVAAKGGLYVPIDYLPGEKVPLVIQTHGWNSRRFEIDGESTAAYAAQALAGSGIAVAQLGEAQDSFGNTQEGPIDMALYQGLIDELDKRGLIDRNRVGLQAWSRTGYSVRYTLSFSKYPFAAALVVDGWEAGLVQYALSTTWDMQRGGHTSEDMNGAKPFGAGLQIWLKNSPMFNLDRVHTPVLQFMLGRYSFMNMWESFAGLKRLQKPVEMIYLPDSNHWPIRPSERMTVQQGAVDWFRFWLQGYEDADPAKIEQYARWRELRDIHRADLANSSNASHQ